MQIIIDIDEDDYKLIKDGGNIPSNLRDLITVSLFNRIRNGKLLPKGHGRLIECERLQEVFRRNVVDYASFKQLFDIAPTIVEEDKE